MESVRDPPKSDVLVGPIKLNIGGVLYQTSRETLLKGSARTFFHGLLDERMKAVKDDTGAYFIDRDGDHFSPILGYLRSGELYLPAPLIPAKVYAEAAFYGVALPPLREQFYRSKIVPIVYHAFDDLATFRNKVEVELARHEAAGWCFVHSQTIAPSSASDEPPTYLLYFQRSLRDLDFAQPLPPLVGLSPAPPTPQPSSPTLPAAVRRDTRDGQS